MIVRIRIVEKTIVSQPSQERKAGLTGARALLGLPLARMKGGVRYLEVVLADMESRHFLAMMFVIVMKFPAGSWVAGSGVADDFREWVRMNMIWLHQLVKLVKNGHLVKNESFIVCFINILWYFWFYSSTLF